MDLKAGPEQMQFKAEHQEVPKEEAGVRSSGALKKWHRGRNLVAKRRQKQKEWTR
jgi:hypothetical protein